MRIMSSPRKQKGKLPTLLKKPNKPLATLKLKKPNRPPAILKEASRSSAILKSRRRKPKSQKVRSWTRKINRKKK